MKQTLLTFTLLAFTLRIFAAETKPCSDQIQFALNLHQSLATESAKENITSAPLAVFEALEALRDGASGDGLIELNAFLGKPTTVSWCDIDSLEARVRFTHSLGIWLLESGWFKDDYVRRVSPRHHAVFGEFSRYGRTDDFAEDGLPGVISQMNAWAQDETHGRINELFTPENVTKDTTLIVASALYFKGKWRDPFESRLTKDDLFHSAAGTDLRVPFMYRHAYLAYTETPEVQAVRLPYGSRERFDMVIVLPREGVAINTVETALTAKKWNSLVSHFESEDVRLTLPKFALSSHHDLKAPLQRMGLKNVFDERGHFDRINDSGTPFNINAIPQQVSVSIDETGSEAAATTFIDHRVGAAANPPPPKLFKADRPFLFAIRHRETGALLLLGRLSQPEAAAPSAK